MTKDEKLLEAKKSAEDRQKKMEARGRRRRWIQIGFPCAVVVSVLIGMAGTPFSDKIAFASYRKNPGTKISENVFRNRDGYRLWQDNALHNHVSCLMGGGEFYDDGAGTRIFPASDCSHMEITMEGRSRIFSNSLCSYLNVDGDIVYYRKNSDRCIYRSYITSGKEELFYSGNAGEVYLYDNYIYFIDLADNRALVRINTEGEGEPEVLVEKEVEEFFVYGSQCVYLTSGKLLCYQEVKADAASFAISGRYDWFFFNGDIIAQSGKRIIGFEPQGGNPRLLYEDKENEFRLVGAGDESFYIQEADSVKKIPVEQKKAGIVTYEENGGSLVTSLLETVDGLNAVVYEAEGDVVRVRTAEFRIESGGQQEGEENGSES